ncbi:MAG: hypothetical protein AABX01_00255 [Candidatus Micrarchaeota archaeon]
MTVKNSGFLLEHTEERTRHVFRVIALKDSQKEPEAMFIGDKAAWAMFLPFEKKRTAGFINFEKTPYSNLLGISFHPYERLGLETTRYLARRRLASRLELIALEHLKKTGFDGMIYHAASTLGRQKMLSKSGRDSVGAHHIDEEIALLRKYLEKKKE